MAVEMKQEVISAPPMAAAPKKPKAKVAKSKPAHPAWATMIEVAVKEMNEKGGSSIPAIKKFILAHNNTVDKVRLTSHMRRAVKTLTVNGTLIQAKGHGLTGSFKLGALKTKVPKKASGATTENKKNSPKKEAAPKTKNPSAPKKAPPRAVMVAKTPNLKEPKKSVTPKAKKPVAQRTKKPVAKKSAMTPKPKEEKKVTAKPKVEKKVPAKPKVEKKAPSKVNKTAKNPKSPKPRTIKKVAAKPKAKPAAPK